MKQHELDELTARIQSTIEYLMSGQFSPAPISCHKAAEVIAATVSVWLIGRDLERE